MAKRWNLARTRYQLKKRGVKHPKTEETMPWDTTNERGLDEWLGDLDYQRWIWPNEWGKSIPLPRLKGSFAKGEPDVYVEKPQD